jgi:hypothetical protein
MTLAHAEAGRNIRSVVYRRSLLKMLVTSNGKLNGYQKHYSIEHAKSESAPQTADKPFVLDKRAFCLFFKIRISLKNPSQNGLDFLFIIDKFRGCACH